VQRMEEELNKDHLFVAEQLNEEMASILSRKVNSKEGMNQFVRDVLKVRLRPDGFTLPVNKAINIVLETAQQIKNINKLAEQEYKLDK